MISNNLKANTIKISEPLVKKVDPNPNLTEPLVKAFNSPRSRYLTWGTKKSETSETELKAALITAYIDKVKLKQKQFEKAVIMMEKEHVECMVYAKETHRTNRNKSFILFTLYIVFFRR